MNWKGQGWWLSIVAAVILIVGGAIIAVNFAEKNAEDRYAGLTVKQENMATYTMYTDKSAPRVVVYEDPACPYCKELEDKAGSTLVEKTLNGDIVLVVKPVNILDPNSPSGTYSSQIIGAYHSIMEQDENGETFNKFRSLIYANQPTHGEELSKDKIVEAMEKSGASQKAIDVFQKEGNWKEKITSDTEKNTAAIYKDVGQVKTPHVTLKGEPLDLANPEWIEQLP